MVQYANFYECVGPGQNIPTGPTITIWYVCDVWTFPKGSLGLTRNLCTILTYRYTFHKRVINNSHKRWHRIWLQYVINTHCTLLISDYQNASAGRWAGTNRLILFVVCNFLSTAASCTSSQRQQLTVTLQSLSIYYGIYTNGSVAHSKHASLSFSPVLKSLRYYIFLSTGGSIWESTALCFYQPYHKKHHDVLS